MPFTIEYVSVSPTPIEPGTTPESREITQQEFEQLPSEEQSGNGGEISGKITGQPLPGALAVLLLAGGAGMFARSRRRKSGDLPVRVEALLSLATFAERAGRHDEAVSALREAAGIDDYAAGPILVDCLLRLERVEDAIAANLRLVRLYPTRGRVLMQGDLLAATGGLDGLPELRKLLSDGKYETILVQNYFDALEAYAAGDLKTVYRALSSVREMVVTPWMMMMAIASDIACEPPESRLAAVERDWLALGLLAVWSRAMEKRIGDDWKIGNRIVAADSCRLLLRYVPDNEFARRRIADWEAEREADRAGRSAQGCKEIFMQ